MILPSKRFSWP